MQHKDKNFMKKNFADTVPQELNLVDFTENALSDINAKIFPKYLPIFAKSWKYWKKWKKNFKKRNEKYNNGIIFSKHLPLWEKWNC